MYVHTDITVRGNESFEGVMNVVNVYPTSRSIPWVGLVAVLILLCYLFSIYV